MIPEKKGKCFAMDVYKYHILPLTHYQQPKKEKEYVFAIISLLYNHWKRDENFLQKKNNNYNH